MATIERAKAKGLGDETGTLDVGKQADLILVDLKALNLSPVVERSIPDIVPNLVYSASGHRVKMVMVAGQVSVDDGVRAEARVQAEAVAQRVAAEPAHTGMALLDAMEEGWL